MILRGFSMAVYNGRCYPELKKIDLTIGKRVFFPLVHLQQIIKDFPEGNKICFNLDEGFDRLELLFDNQNELIGLNLIRAVNLKDLKLIPVGDPKLPK